MDQGPELKDQEGLVGDAPVEEDAMDTVEPIGAARATETDTTRVRAP